MAFGNVGPVDARLVGDAIGGPALFPTGLDVLALASSGLATGVPEAVTVGANDAGAGSAETEAVRAGAGAVGCDATATDETGGEAGGASAGFACERIVRRVGAASAAAPAPTSQEIPRLWQLSHGAVVFTWSLGLVFTPGYVPPWQFAQPVVIPE